MTNENKLRKDRFYLVPLLFAVLMYGMLFILLILFAVKGD